MCRLSIAHGQFRLSKVQVVRNTDLFHLLAVHLFLLQLLLRPSQQP